MSWSEKFARVLLAILFPVVVTACGFHLRGSVSYPFDSVFLNAPTAPAFAAELRRSIEGSALISPSHQPEKLLVYMGDNLVSAISYECVPSTQNPRHVSSSSLRCVPFSRRALAPRTTFDRCHGRASASPTPGRRMPTSRRCRTRPICTRPACTTRILPT